MTCGIYQITCVPTGDTYVGQSVDIEARWESHKESWAIARANNEVRKGFSNFGLTALALIFPDSKFTFEILETCANKELKAFEDYWMVKTKASLNRHFLEKHTPFERNMLVNPPDRKITYYPFLNKSSKNLENKLYGFPVPYLTLYCNSICVGQELTYTPPKTGKPCTVTFEGWLDFTNEVPVVLKENLEPTPKFYILPCEEFEKIAS